MKSSSNIGVHRSLFVGDMVTAAVNDEQEVSALGFFTSGG